MLPHTIKNPPLVRRKADGVLFHANKFLLNNPKFELVVQPSERQELEPTPAKKRGRPKKEK